MMMMMTGETCRVSIQDCLAAIAVSYPEPVRDSLVAPVLLELSSQPFQNIWFLPYLCSSVPVLDQVVGSLVDAIVELLSGDGMASDGPWPQIHMLTSIFLRTVQEQQQNRDMVKRGGVVPVSIPILARILRSCSHTLSTVSVQFRLWVHMLGKVLASCACHGDTR